MQEKYSKEKEEQGVGLQKNWTFKQTDLISS